MNEEPVSTQKSSQAGKGCLVLFGAVFVLFGLIFVYVTTVRPYLATRAASDWQETQCTVVKSEIDVDRGGDSTTYRPRIEFDYQFNGADYRSDTFDFTSLNRSRTRCQEIVNAHPVGTKVGCFVNPEDPEKAVIVRDYEFSYFGFFFPLIFSGFGFAAICAALFLKDNGSKSISGSAKATPSNAFASSGSSTSSTGSHSLPSSKQHPSDLLDQNWEKPQKLKPTQTRLLKFIIGLLVALFWNGIVAALLYGFLTENPNNFEWFFVLFMIPFVLVGLALIFGVFYLLGGLLNPAVELALSTGAVERGGSVDVAWQLIGRTSSIRTLKVLIEGEESATYRRGTDTITDTNVFCSIPVTETDSQEEITFGSSPVTIPADTMHTFSADRNNIKWRVVVQGDIPLWPNINESFEFRVKP